MTTVKLNLPGLNKVMASSGVQALVNREANEIAARTGLDGVRAEPRLGRYTASAVVLATDEESRLAEARDKTITRAVRGTPYRGTA
jgi:hypothetical protein